MKKANIFSKQVPEMNILLLGETGVGKSTWINAFANFIHYKTLTEAENSLLFTPIPFKFTEYDKNYNQIGVEVGTKDENESGRAGHSQTRKCKVHKFLYGNTTVRVIDTPGMGDTRGDYQDKLNFDNILTTIKAFKEIHGICILLKPTDTRLSLTFRFCIKELFTFLHKSAIKNLIFCFTNANPTNFKPGETLTTLKVLLKQNDLGHLISPQSIYCFDSEAFKYLAGIKNKNPVNYTIKEKLGYVASWDKSLNETKRLLNYISNLNPHRVKHTLNLNEARKFASEIINLQKPLNEIKMSDVEECKIKINDAMDGIDIYYIHQVGNLTQNQFEELEEKIIQASAVLLTCFLKTNAIIPYNDAKIEYLSLILKGTKALGADKCSIDDKKMEVDTCSYEKKLFEACVDGRVSIVKVRQVIKALTQLKNISDRLKN